MVDDVVLAVKTDVCAVALVKVTEVGERLQVAGLMAPEGALVTEQESVTVPLNELAGVTVMVEVLPLVAPGATEILPLALSVKLLPELLGASQNPAHPTTKLTISGAAVKTKLLHLPALIASPRLTSVRLRISLAS